MAPPPVVQLACKLCQTKKLKCDKGNPCSNCDRAGASCQPVTRSRLPRGRNGGRKSGSDDLRDRVKRLEALVRGQYSPSKAAGGSTRPTPPAESLSIDIGSSQELDNVPRNSLGGQFWATLCNEVDSLRDVLDEEAPDDVSDPPTPPPNKGDQSNSVFNFVLCSPSSFVLTPGALRRPPKAVTIRLCDLFFRDVDPIFKVVHAQTIRSTLLDGQPYFGFPPDSAPIEALSYSIYYSAVNALDPATCFREFAEAKQTLLQQLRFSLEVYLVRADFINTTDIPTLQAFTLFLASQRTGDASRSSWTLLSLAVRIATAMSLNHDPPASAGVFETEMRRRLWHSIRLLDTQGSLDRGTDILIQTSSFTTRKPLNINDEDISPETSITPTEPDAFTDMTLPSMAVEASTLFRQFTQYNTPNTQITWEQRNELALIFKEVLETKYISKCNPDILLQSYVMRVGTSMSIAARLMSGRPMQRPLTTPPTHEKHMYLDLAVEVLRGYDELQDEPHFKRWQWFLWLPWHALAVALAEICVQDQSLVVLQAWPVVQRAYDTFAEKVADTSSGLLWKPIQKMMRKAQERSKVGQRLAQPGQARRDSQMRDVKMAAGMSSMPMDTTPPQSNDPDDIGAAFSTGMQISPNHMGATPPEDQAWQNWETFLDDMMTSNEFTIDASSYEAWSGQTGMQI